MVWAAEYESFGAVQTDVAVVENPFRFPGQYFDGETGHSYNYFRDYDPSTGRYIESDPIGLDGGLNTYTYVFSDPLLYIDPLGLKSRSETRRDWNEEHGARVPASGDPCNCFGKVLGLDTAAGTALVAGGQPTKRKRFTGRGTSKGTSPISSYLSEKLPQKMPVRLPAPTTNRPFAKTAKLGRFLGRWAPIVGWVLLAADAVELAKCMSECEEGGQCEGN